MLFDQLLQHDCNCLNDNTTIIIQLYLNAQTKILNNNLSISVTMSMDILTPEEARAVSKEYTRLALDALSSTILRQVTTNAKCGATRYIFRFSRGAEIDIGPLIRSLRRARYTVISQIRGIDRIVAVSWNKQSNSELEMFIDYMVKEGPTLACYTLYSVINEVYDMLRSNDNVEFEQTCRDVRYKRELTQASRQRKKQHYPPVEVESSDSSSDDDSYHGDPESSDESDDEKPANTSDESGPIVGKVNLFRKEPIQPIYPETYELPAQIANLQIVNEDGEPAILSEPEEYEIV